MIFSFQMNFKFVVQLNTWLEYNKTDLNSHIFTHSTLPASFTALAVIGFLKLNSAWPVVTELTTGNSLGIKGN